MDRRGLNGEEGREGGEEGWTLGMGSVEGGWEENPTMEQ